MKTQKNQKTQKTQKIIITIDSEKYDVTHFKHPGEGICNAYIRDYNNKDATEEFEHYHYTDPPFEMLELAKKDGFHKGIRYVQK